MSPPPWWQWWANPLLHRYCRSRLRRGPLTAWLLIVLIAGWFMVLFLPAFHKRWDVFQYEQLKMAPAMRAPIPGARPTRNDVAQLLDDVIYRMQATSALKARIDNPVHYSRTPVFPLLVLQGLLLFVLGTGQVAGGMTAEADEGSVDYQRLTPVTPMAKTLGYLMGLPIREYVLFAATLPCTAWCLWQGHVPWQAWLPVYSVFMCAVLLYHLTGLVSGTVLKNRRWAFLLSMGLVFTLYTLVPQGARLGFPFVRYLTLWPVLVEHSSQMAPVHSSILTLSTGIEASSIVPFFHFKMPDLLFTFMVQGSFILSMLVMVWRKWKKSESHLLSRVWGVGIFLWINVLLIGNALPLAKDGSLFPSQGLSRGIEKAAQDAAAFGLRRAPKFPAMPAPHVAEAAGMSCVFALNLLLLIIMLIIMMTPFAETQQRGLRRALKHGRLRAPLLGDSSPALPLVALLVLVGTVAWWCFNHGVAGSHWFSASRVITWASSWRFLAVLGLTSLLFHAALETSGGRLLFLISVFAGLLPVMAGLIIAVSQKEITETAIWVAGISPIAELIYASLVTLPEPFIPAGPLRTAMNEVSIRWTFIVSVLLVWQWSRLHLHWKRRRAALLNA